VYHFTDVPSFVSGGSIVFFDPHTHYLPGTTASHPGLKLRIPSDIPPQPGPGA
jgi:sacsin